MGKYYRISQFSDSRYRIYDPLGVHMDLFIGKEKALLFDTGYGFHDLRTEVEQITELPLLVVNSHGHVDHALGNDQFDCPIFIHPDDIPICEDHHGRYRKELAINYARTAVDYFTGEPVGAIGPDFNEEQYLRKGTGELVPVTEGHIFDLGGMKLEVVELPGHTPGSIGLLDRDQRILYAADAMNADFWLFMEEACPLSVYRQTLSKASGLEFDTMIMGAAVAIIGFLIMGLAGTNYTLIMIGYILKGLGCGPIFTCGFALAAAVVDYGEWKFGIRSEGLINSCVSFGQKVGNGLGSAASSWILAIGGYVGTAAVQSDSAIAAIRFAFSYFGAILGVVMLIVCFLFDIDKHMDQVHASLEAKMK